MEPVGTVDKAIDILFHLNARPEACGVTAIGRALDMPKSSTHRLLSALGRRGLVERDAGGRYRPGIGLVALGLGALDREPAVVAARPVLEEEAAALGETVFLVVARAGRAVVLAKAEGTGFLRAAPQVGAEVPLHATAVGKLFLAFAPERVHLPEALEAFTARTARDREELDAEVERARAQGWAENREEWMPGLAVVAAPVRVGGRMVAAIAVAAAAQNYAALGRGKLRRRACAAAERIEARLGGASR